MSSFLFFFMFIHFDMFNTVCTYFHNRWVYSSFLYFRFVQAYSRKTLCFGKVEKQISCVVIKTCGIPDSSEPQDDVSDNFSLSKSLKGGIGLFGGAEVAIVTQDSEGRTIEDGSVCIGVTEKSDVEYMLSKRACDVTSTNFEKRENSPGHVTIPVLGCLEHGNEVTWNDLAQKESMPQIRKRRKRTSSTKKATKTYQIQAMKPSLPGSMARYVSFVNVSFAWMNAWAISGNCVSG